MAIRQFFIPIGGAVGGVHFSQDDTTYHHLIPFGLLPGVSPGGSGTGIPEELTPVVLGTERSYILTGAFPPTYINERKGITYGINGIFDQTPEVDFLVQVTLSISASCPALNITPLDAVVVLTSASSVDSLFINVFEIVGQTALAINASGVLRSSYTRLNAAVTLAIVSATLNPGIVATAALAITVAGELTTQKLLYTADLVGENPVKLVIEATADFTTHKKSWFTAERTLFMFAEGYLTTADNPQYFNGVKWYRNADLDSLVPDTALVTGPMMTANNTRVFILQKEDPPPSDGAVLRSLLSTNNKNFTEDTANEITLTLGDGATAYYMPKESWRLIGLSCSSTEVPAAGLVGKFAILSKDSGIIYQDVYPTGFSPTDTQSWAKVNGFIPVAGQDGHLIAYGEFYPIAGQEIITDNDQYSIIGYHSYDYGETWKDPIVVAGTPNGSGTVFEKSYAVSGICLPNGLLFICCKSTEGRPAVWRSSDRGVTWIEFKPTTTWANHRIAALRESGAGYHHIAAARNEVGQWMIMLVGWLKSATQELEDLIIAGDETALAEYEMTQADGNTFLYLWRSMDDGHTWDDLSEKVNAQINVGDDPAAPSFPGWGWLVGFSTGVNNSRGFVLGLDGSPKNGVGTATHFYAKNNGEIWHACTYDADVFPNGTEVEYYHIYQGAHVSLTQRRITNSCMHIFDDLAGTDPTDAHFFLQGFINLSATDATYVPTGGYHFGHFTADPKTQVRTFATGGYVFGGEAPSLGILKYRWPATIDPPDYPLEEKAKRMLVRSPQEAGTINTRTRWMRGKRAFHLHWEALPSAQKSTMFTFFESIHGGATAFDWTHPLTSVVYTVRLIGDSVTAEHQSPNVWRVEFDIEEL